MLYTGRQVKIVMAKGQSGRVVIELDPDLKRDLYSILDKDGLTLKNWFIGQAELYVSESVQPTLDLFENHKEGLNQ